MSELVHQWNNNRDELLRKQCLVDDEEFQVKHRWRSKILRFGRALYIRLSSVKGEVIRTQEIGQLDLYKNSERHIARAEKLRQHSGCLKECVLYARIAELFSCCSLNKLAWFPHSATATFILLALEPATQRQRKDACGEIVYDSKIPGMLRKRKT